MKKMEAGSLAQLLKTVMSSESTEEDVPANDVAPPN